MSVVSKPPTCASSTLLMASLEEWSDVINTTTDTPAASWERPEGQCHANRISTTPDVEAGESAWITKAMPRLQQIAALRENWDDRGSRGTDQAIVEAAAYMLSRLMPEDLGAVPVPFVCGVPGGGLQLEWTSPRKHLELEFTGPGTVVFLKEEKRLAGDIMDSGEYDPTDLDLTRQLLTWFVTE